MNQKGNEQNVQIDQSFLIGKNIQIRVYDDAEITKLEGKIIRFLLDSPLLLGMAKEKPMLSTAFIVHLEKEIHYEARGIFGKIDQVIKDIIVLIWDKQELDRFPERKVIEFPNSIQLYVEVNNASHEQKSQIAFENLDCISKEVDIRLID